jgi:hypothetical protein
MQRAESCSAGSNPDWLIKVDSVCFGRTLQIKTKRPPGLIQSAHAPAKQLRSIFMSILFDFERLVLNIFYIRTVK